MGVTKFDCRNLRFQVCLVIAYENISLEITTVSSCEFSTYVNKIQKLVLVNPLTLNVFKLPISIPNDKNFSRFQEGLKFPG